MHPIEHDDKSGRDAIAVVSRADDAMPPPHDTTQQRARVLPERPTLAAGLPSIRLSRFPSAIVIPQLNVPQEIPEVSEAAEGSTQRGRSISEPPQIASTEHLTPRPITPTSLARSVVPEASESVFVARPSLAPPGQNGGRLRRVSVAARSALGLMPVSGSKASASIAERHEYDPDLVHFLDIVDPEIATLSTLTNVQNSLFVPDLGTFLERRPTYTLTRPTASYAVATGPNEPVEGEKVERPDPIKRALTRDTITSKLDGKHYAVLPHGVSLASWSEEDKMELNDHVRHMLHSRRAKFRRGLKGFGQYVRRPLGFLITLYATLITLFGLAWVLFLIGWIKVGGQQLYIIHVIDLVLVALFAVVGDGLAPFRAIDTYHMIFIAHYHHLTWRLRREQRLPKLKDKNDLPTDAGRDADVENAAEADKHQELSILTPKQQQRLTHHQNKFAKSHTFYKPHETTTHRAFPLHLLVTVVVLLDCHSLLQIALGTCTWAIDYRVRPFALTTVILCCSITCNVGAGIGISVGDRMTRKKDVVEKMFRQQLTQEAMDSLERKREKPKESNKLRKKMPQTESS